MKIVSTVAIALFAVASFCSHAQTETRPTADEEALFIAINDYRVEQGLPKVLYSPELSWLARRHTEDQQEIGLTHGWKDCPSGLECFNEAPARFNLGISEAFEISCISNSALQCLNLWKNSSAHNSVILEQGIWNRFDWPMAGVGRGGLYTNVYFTDETTSFAIPIPLENGDEWVDTSGFPVGLFVSDELGQQSIQILGDEFQRFSGVWFTFRNDGSPVWYTFIAEQTNPNFFAGDFLLAEGTLENGAESFDPSKGTIELVKVNDNEFRVVLELFEENFIRAVTMTRFSID